jgi:site-specific DNA recombinase
MTTMKMRAVAYVRMSTQQQENSPERQREQIRAYAEQQGYHVVRWYEDLGMRGSDINRPQFQAMLQDAQAGQFEVILADELSRLTRLGTLDFYTQFAAPLEQAGVIVDTVSEGKAAWDGDDLGSAIMELVHQHKPFSESLGLGERVAKGLYNLASQAQLFVGPRPFGMDYARDGEKSRVGYIPGPPEEVAVVRRMFARYAEGASLADIANELTRQGVLTSRGCKWTRNNVHAVLTNPVYAGDYVFGRVARGKYYRLANSNPKGHVRRKKKTKKTKHNIERNSRQDWVVVPNTHHGIVERELFDRVQGLLKENRKHTSPSRARGEHPLSGLLFCPACGHVMYGTTRKLKGRVRVYVCGRYMTSRECVGYWVREDEALTSIAQALQEKLEDASEIERLRASLLRQQTCQADDEQFRSEQMRQQVKRLDAQISEATSRLARVPERMFSTLLAEIEKMEAERADAQRQLAGTSQPPNAVAALDELIANVRRLPEVIQSADADQIHQLLRASIERVDLDIQVIALPKYKRFVWQEGNVTLRKSSLLSTTGPGRI